MRIGQYFISKFLQQLNTPSNVIFIEEYRHQSQRFFSSNGKNTFTFSPKDLSNLLKEKNVTKIKKVARKDWTSLANQKRKFINNNELTFPYLSKFTLDHLNEKSTIILGNSTIIRSFDYFIPKVSSSIGHNIISNRGVSGIEGFISSAYGASLKTKNLILLFLGDISFLHDLNALAVLSNLKKRIVVILLNNKCGGIFNGLNLNFDNATRRSITTPHQFEFQKVAECFNLQYKRISTKKEFSRHIRNVNLIKSPIIYECVIDDLNNNNLFKQLRTLNN